MKWLQCWNDVFTRGGRSDRLHWPNWCYLAIRMWYFYFHYECDFFSSRGGKAWQLWPLTNRRGGGSGFTPLSQLKFLQKKLQESWGGEILARPKIDAARLRGGLSNQDSVLGKCSALAAQTALTSVFKKWKKKRKEKYHSLVDIRWWMGERVETDGAPDKMAEVGK